MEAVLPSFDDEVLGDKEADKREVEGGVKDRKTAKGSEGQSKESNNEREEHWKEKTGMKLGKSMKCRPGAGKRREKVVAMERERFAKNLAVMAAGPRAERTDGEEKGGHGEDEEEGREEKARRERWAAIRRFIGGRVDEDE